METITQWITSINDVLWTYILVIMLLGCAFWFTLKTKFVQFRMLGAHSISFLRRKLL